MLYICNFSNPEHPDREQDRQLLMQLRAQLTQGDLLVLLSIGAVQSEEFKALQLLTNNLPMHYKAEGVTIPESDDFCFISSAEFVELCTSSQGIITLY